MVELNFFCINLNARNDRWVDCLKQFSEQNLKVDRWDAKPRPENRRFGAWLSHREIIEYAKMNKWKCVVVFEDDIKFLTPEFKKECYLALNELSNTNWYILYFGGLLWKWGILKKVAKMSQVFQVKKLFEAHAVIYNEKFYDIYLHKHPNMYNNKIWEYYLDNTYRAFDEWYANYIQELYPCYITRKMLVTQKNDFSDIEGKTVWRKSRAEIVFVLYKYNMWWAVEKFWKYIKWLINLFKNK